MCVCVCIFLSNLTIVTKLTLYMIKEWQMFKVLFVNLEFYSEKAKVGNIFADILARCLNERNI